MRSSTILAAFGAALAVHAADIDMEGLPDTGLDTSAWVTGENPPIDDMVDANDFATAESDALVPRREKAKRVRDIAGVEASSRHLVEQRLECVVREPVEQRNPEPFLGQLVCRGYAPETRADNDHMRHLSHILI